MVELTIIMLLALLCLKKNEYGEDYIKELRSEGLDWNLIYEYEEVDCNFI